MSDTLTSIPLAAADQIRTHGWTQGHYQANDGALCLHGAILACTPQSGDAEIVRILARRQGYNEDWNDAENRTQDEVLDALVHIDTSDAALEAAFGPQRKSIVALIRRAATFTQEEDAAMDAARNAALQAARNAALQAAWDAV